jgi:excisionase family DNA binding protein
VKYAPDLPEKLLVRPDEVARFLSVEKRTVYEWYNRGLITGTKPENGMLWIDRESVVAFVDAGRGNTMEIAPPRARRVINSGIK